MLFCGLHVLAAQLSINVLFRRCAALNYKFKVLLLLDGLKGEPQQYDSNGTVEPGVKQKCGLN